MTTKDTKYRLDNVFFDISFREAIARGKVKLRFLTPEAEQRALQFLHIHYSNIKNCSSAPGSNKQDPPDRTLDLSLLFRYEQAASLKSLPSSEPSKSLPYWFSKHL